MPLTLEQKVLCVRLYAIYEKPQDVQRAWRKKLGTDPPTAKTILAINKKFDSTGSVLTDMTGSKKGRPKTTTTAKNVALVEAAIRKDSKKSVRALAEDLGIARSSVMRIKQEVDKNVNIETVNEVRTLKDTILDLNRKVDILQCKLNPGSTTSPSKAIIECDDRGVPDPLQIFENDNITKVGDPLFNPLENGGLVESNQMTSLNSPGAMIHLTPVMSSTENGTQILHVDPETFRLLQDHCSKSMEMESISKLDIISPEV